MGKDRARVLAWALGSVVLILAATLVLDWFRAKVEVGIPGVDSIAIDLRSLHTCVPQGPCVSVALSTLQGTGNYPRAAQAAFFGGLVLCAFVGWAVVVRLRGGELPERYARLGYLIGVLCFIDAAFAAYVFGPESQGLETISVTVHRTWAPMAMLIGCAGAVVAIYVSAHASSTDDAGTYKPVQLPLPVAVARPVPPAMRHAMPLDTPPAPVPAVQSAPEIALPRTITAPAELRGKLSFAVVTAEISYAGLEARREDGVVKTIAWREVVGAVARRLPPDPPYEGATFVDVVSTAGSTLRVLPWTRLTGEALAGTGEVRARALVQLIVARCPESQLDPLTRKFADDAKPAAQLPDAATLAAHDERLA